MSQESERLINVAKGCLDYTGGFRGEELETYHQGMWKVIRALRQASLNDPNDRQTNELEKIGKGR